jgi:CheY-like chemotaxis protein
MPTIVVADEDRTSREALVARLRRLFAQARVVAVRDLESDVVAREADVVLARLAVAERFCRAGSPADVPVVALTDEMSPDTLLRAEALGIAGALRTPVSAAVLAAALGPMLATGWR